MLNLKNTKEIKMFSSFSFNGYKFGICCTKASYDKMTLNSKTYKSLCFIKYNANCTKRAVQQFIYGEVKYPSYGCFVWKNLLADNLIEKHGKGKNTTYIITSIGEAYIDYINRKNYCLKNG